MIKISTSLRRNIDILIGASEFAAELISTAPTTVLTTTQAATTTSGVVTTAPPNTTTAGT